MSLVALDGTPLVMIGSGGVQLQNNSSPALTTITMDAANEACIMIGRIFTEDGGTHTIDTTGSSSLGWLTAAVTFASGSTTVKVGLAAVDTAAGPPPRAVNSTNVITFDVSKSMIGSGSPAITASAWNEHVPDAGTKTIANGELVAFCIQMTARGGTDSVLAVVSGIGGAGFHMPVVTSYVGAAYGLSASVPNAVITFSDGTLGFFFGGHVQVINANTTWNSGSATKEYGNFVQAQFPMKVYGLYGVYQFLTASADSDIVLYLDPLGTPVAQKTIAIDANTVAAAGSSNRWFFQHFPAPYLASAGQPLAVVLKPGAVTAGLPVRTFNASAHQKSDMLGLNCYAVNRASGAFAAQNSSKDRCYLGLLVGAFETGITPTLALGL